MATMMPPTSDTQDVEPSAEYEAVATLTINPEDPAQVERLRVILHGGTTGSLKWLCSNVSDLQRALRLAARDAAFSPAQTCLAAACNPCAPQCRPLHEPVFPPGQQPGGDA